jgi:excisionase family DNA binding protein
MNQTRYLTTSDLVVRYGYHIGSIRRMIRQKRLPAVRVGRRYLFQPEAIAAFEATRSVLLESKPEWASPPSATRD